MSINYSQWMDGAGPDADIVLSCRVRLARNLLATPFPHRMDDSQAQTMLARVEEAVHRIEAGWHLKFLRLANLTPIERQVLVEKHLVSPMLVQEPVRYEAVAIDDRESVSIMVNEEDHLRIQVVLPGLQLAECWDVANHMDDALEQHVDYAFDPHSGYIAACPTNIGTAMRASVMMHLPALVFTHQASQVFTTLAQLGMVVRGLYGEGSEALGNIFQVSNQVSLGLSEEEFIHNLTIVTQQIVGRERHARQHLLQNAGIAMADRVGRAWGILTHARIISSEEALRLLSEVKIGADMGLIEAPHSATYAQLTVATRPGFLQMAAGRELNAAERDQLRADNLRRLLGEQ